MAVAVVAMACLQNVNEPTMRFRVPGAGGESRQTKRLDLIDQESRSSTPQPRFSPFTTNVTKTGVRYCSHTQRSDK
jgi:hypothetical protein